MPHLLDKRDSWGNGLALWVLAVMVFVVPFAWWSVKQVDLENNVKNWLPSDDPQARVLDWYEEHFSPEERVLISWDDAAIDDPRVKLLADRLEGFVDAEGVRRDNSPYVDRVFTHDDALARMHRFDVPREEALDRLVGVLVGEGPLRIKYSEVGGYNDEKTRSLVVRALNDELGLDVTLHDPATNFAEYELPIDVVERIEKAPPRPDGDADEAEVYEPAFDSWSEHDLRISWRGMHAYPEMVAKVRRTLLALTDRDERLIESTFFTPGAPVAVAAVVTEAGLEDRTALFAEIDRIAEEVGIPSASLHLGGGPYAGHELNGYLKKVVWNDDAPARQFNKRSPFLASMFVGILLSFVMLRSVRLATLVLVTSIYTMLITVALVPVTGGSMNVVLVVMPTLLMVLTISAGIHLCNYWRHAVTDGSERPVVDATRMAFRPCVYAALTTAIGLLSLWTSPLAPVRDFGFYSAVGCVLLTLVVLLGLPSMMQFWRGRVSTAQVEAKHETWRDFGGLLCRHATVVSVVSLTVFAGCVYGLQWFRTETKVIKYFPDDTRVVQDYDFLEDNLAGIVSVEFLIRFDDERLDSDVPRPASTKTFLDRLEVVRAVQERLESHPEISGSVSLATFFPVTEQLPADASTGQKLRWNLRSTRIEKKLKGDDAESASSYFSSAEDAVELPSGLGDTLRIESGDELWRVSANVAIMTDADYGHLVGDPRKGRIGDLNEMIREELRLHPSAGHIVTGMVPLFLRTQQAVLDSLITSFALAFGIIACVMMLLLRSPLSGALAMVPNLLPVGVVFGLVAWAGIPVDIGTMITASVALGIAVDGTLHLLTWYRKGIERGLSRNDSVAEALAHCGPAMFQTSMVIGCGLLVLSSAELLLVHRFGWLMASLVGAALVADVILLPALLAGPLGRLVEGSVKRRMATANDAAASQPSNAPTPERELQPQSFTAPKENLGGST